MTPTDKARELEYRERIEELAYKIRILHWENKSDAIVALLATALQREQDEAAERFDKAVLDCAEILPNKVECVLTGSDIERIRDAILSQPKGETREEGE